MRRLWIALLAVTLVSHLPFAVGLAFALERLGAPRPGWIAAAVAAALVSLVRGRLPRARADQPIPTWRLLLLEEPYHAHWCATLAAWPLFIVAVAGVSLHAMVVTVTASNLSRLGAAALASYAVGLVIGFYGVMVRRRWVRVRTIEISIADLPAGFEGYRIAQLSDLHIGGLWPRRRAERWVTRLNALDVDLVALTGDYVTHGAAFHHDIAEVLSSMRARDGAVAVLGNHDYFGDAEALVTLLRARGVVVLRNEQRAITRGGDCLTIAGVDDTWARRDDVERAMSGRPSGGPTIALAHDPRLFPALARRGAALVLSGHTHWGQIALPFWPTRYNLSRLSYRYHAGVYRRGPATLYVSPGLGTTGPPLRLGAPPEITVLQLRRA
jgi:hypothetical protein